MATCDRPVWELAANAVSDPDALFLWPFCAYSIDIGLAVVGALLTLAVFVALLNWSESWVTPATWLALAAPMVAAAALPGVVIRIIGGLVTFAVASILIGAWYWWSRA
jgi:hypothetical protein